MLAQPHDHHPMKIWMCIRKKQSYLLFDTETINPPQILRLQELPELTETNTIPNTDLIQNQMHTTA